MAVTLDAAALATATGADAATTARLLPVVSAVVERYAPDAPADVQNEAAIRLAAWLDQSQDAIGLQSIDISGVSTTALNDHGAAFRRSGAKGLLSSWATRNLGVC